jgi:hypothetical protein
MFKKTNKNLEDERRREVNRRVTPRWSSQEGSSLAANDLSEELGAGG